MRCKALHKAVKAMETKADIQCNKIMHLEDSMVMYGIYNSETLEKLIILHITYITLQLQKKDYLQERLTQHIHSM